MARAVEKDDVRARNRSGLANVARLASEALNASGAGSGTILTLDDAYERYKIGKGFGRADLFAVVIDAIKDLQARIGSVDEAAVKAIDDRCSALERVIGNALAQERRGPGRPPKVKEAVDG